MGQFGEKFRKARERKNISLDDVSSVTKIGSRMLLAIEQERFDQLPGGIFNKGFIRAYAKHVGLDDEEAVNDYLACLRQVQIEAQTAIEPQRPAAPRILPGSPGERKPGYQGPSLNKQGRVEVEEELPELQLPRAQDVLPPHRNYRLNPERGFSWRFPAIAAVILVLVSFLWMRHSRGAHPEAAAPAGPQTAVGAPSASVASAKSISSASSAATETSRHTISRQTNGGSSLTSPPGSESLSASPKANIGSENGSENDGTARSFPAANAPGPNEDTQALKLVIRAAENSWISVSADGQPVTHETLIAPAAISVRAHRQIVARIGNAGGVSFLFNGQEISPQGTEAEVKTLVFDAAGMRVAAPANPPSPSPAVDRN